jgi:LuxR family quorum sensing-dependent transcriptional regulator
MSRRSAFEFIEEIGQLTTADDVMHALQGLLDDQGISYHCLSFLPSATQTFTEVTLALRFPAGFIEHYTAQGFIQYDPALRHVRTSIFPFRWFKDVPLDPSEPLEAEAVQTCRAFGLVDGIVVPVSSARFGRLGQVWFGGAQFELSDDEWPALHLSAFYAFDRVMQIGGGGITSESTLTPREREVLTLSAVGLTSPVIADRLHISERTVREHMGNARRKLGATTRTQAVMIALRDRLIQP